MTEDDSADDINPLQGVLDQMNVALGDLDAAWKKIGTQVEQGGLGQESRQRPGRARRPVADQPG